MSLSLFLGFPIDSGFVDTCVKINPFLFAFLTRGGNYLQQIEWAGNSYLGKFCSQEIPTIEELDCLHTHLLSLLQKLAPKHTLNPILLAISLPEQPSL